MNLIILMAGSTKAFKSDGYFYPKNLIEINGIPMLEHVINNLAPVINHCNSVTFIVSKNEDVKFHTGKIIRLMVPSANVIPVEEQTAGAACSALMGIDYIEEDAPLLIMNGDQILDIDFQMMLEKFSNRDWDGGMVVFKALHPRWSYVRCNDEGWVEEAAEKEPISDQATAGVCYYSAGIDFIDAAMSSIEKNASVGGAYFIVPSYNEMLLKHKRIGTFKIEAKNYHSLMTPQLLRRYESQLLMEEA